METRVSLGGQWTLGSTTAGQGEKRGYQTKPIWEGFEAQVPGSVMNDLQRAGLIPDPRWCRNPEDVSWVGRRDWWMQKRFIAPQGEKQYLRFEGVDTFADVFIDGELIASLDNQFIPHEIDVTGKVVPGKEHLITVKLEGPEHATARVAGKPLGFFNGWYHRLYARKAQMSYGWDWARYVPTLGILRPAEVIGVTGPRIKDVWVRTLSIEEKCAVIEVNSVIENVGEEKRLEIALLAVSNLGGKAEFSELVTLPPGETTHTTRMEVADPTLWWPSGYGEPMLYRGEVTLRENDEPVASKKVSFGIRTVELVLEKSGNNAFCFKINGREVFAQGANWVPIDVEFTTSHEKYRAAFELLKHARMNMLRVWGGSIIEDPYFYELADSYGVMLWHDMMYACGEYPTDDGFREQVRTETKAIMTALRNHPSIVLWCGNNENAWLLTEHPLFSKDIPDVVSQMDPDRPYWPSSPWSPKGLEPNSQDAGDCHDWSAWHGGKGRIAVEENRCLFLSEYGCQAPAELATLKRIIPSDDIGRLGPSWSLRMGVVELLMTMSAPWMGTPTGDMDRTLNAMWCAQKEIDARAFYLHRARILESKGGSGGVLVWAFGEAWPAINWSIVDFLLHPKAAYYGIKRASNAVSMTFIQKDGVVKTFISNGGLEPIEGRMQVTTHAIHGRKLAEGTAKASVPALKAVEGPEIKKSKEAVVIHFEFEGENGLTAADTQWLEVVSADKMPKGSVEAAWVDNHNLRVVNNGDGVLRMVQVRDASGKGVLWNDNFFDLLPGEERVLTGRLIPEMTPYDRATVTVSAENAPIRRIA